MSALIFFASVHDASDDYERLLRFHGVAANDNYGRNRMSSWGIVENNFDEV